MYAFFWKLLLNLTLEIIVSVTCACVCVFLWRREQEVLSEQACEPAGWDLPGQRGREGGPGAPADSGPGEPEEESGWRSARRSRWDQATHQGMSIAKVQVDPFFHAHLFKLLHHFSYGSYVGFQQKEEEYLQRVVAGELCLGDAEETPVCVRLHGHRHAEGKGNFTWFQVWIISQLNSYIIIATCTNSRCVLLQFGWKYLKSFSQ